jgi:hypothetical protein
LCGADASGLLLDTGRFGRERAIMTIGVVLIVLAVLLVVALILAYNDLITRRNHGDDWFAAHDESRGA